MAIYSLGDGMKPLSSEGKNNLPIGTVLHLNGYSNSDYVIVANLGDMGNRWGYGSIYKTVDIEKLTQGRAEAATLEWMSEKKDGRIQLYITDRILSQEETAEIWNKSEAQRLEKEQAESLKAAEYSRLVEIGRELFKKYIPEDAQALLVAKHNVDESDSMTDYFAHRTDDTVILNYSMHKRDLFPEMRKAAARIPETAHLGPGKGIFECLVVLCEDIVSMGQAYYEGNRSHWHGEPETFYTRAEAESFIEQSGTPEPIGFQTEAGIKTVNFKWHIIEEKIEHREKYSMGEGYYLKAGHGDATGWRVEKVLKGSRGWDNGLYYSIAKRCIFVDKPEDPESSQVTAPTLTENTEKNGLEIRFPEKPSAEILDKLKSAGWRWSRFSRCWYHIQTPANLTFATLLIQELVKQEANHDSRKQES